MDNFNQSLRLQVGNLVVENLMLTSQMAQLQVENEKLKADNEKLKAEAPSKPAAAQKKT